MILQLVLIFLKFQHFVSTYEKKITTIYNHDINSKKNH
jgi:hypothetical protein